MEQLQAAMSIGGTASFLGHLGSPPRMEWQKCLDISTAAVNAKHPITITELLRRPTETQLRQAALINNLSEHAVDRKVVSILPLIIGRGGKESLSYKYPYMVVSAATLKGMINNCEETFRKTRSRTLERYTIFARKQQPNESLRQFWNALRGMAARCDFEQQTENLMMENFIQNLYSKAVQKRLCTEPKGTPKEALSFVVAFEEDIS